MRAAAEERLVEVDRVGVDVPEDPRDVAARAIRVDLVAAAGAERPGRDRAVEVHHGAPAVVELVAAVRERRVDAVVAVDVDPLAGDDARVLRDPLGVGQRREAALSTGRRR